MNTIVRVATEKDWDAIAQLNHNVYALELGQHAPNQQGRKTDRLHDTNLYLVAYVEEELVGMLSITLPSRAPFSTLKRVTAVSEDILMHLSSTAEIRLLAVKPAYRGQGLFDALISAAIKTCYQHAIDRVLISAIEDRVPLYEYMGFQAIADPVMEGKASYYPMMITRQLLESSPYQQKLAQLQRYRELA